MGRNRKCDTGHDVSWRWAWKPVGKKRPMRLKSGDGLCEALRGTRVINIGDSLTHQLVETWRARRIASSWPVPDGFAYKKSEEGHLSKEIDLANEFARQSRGGRRRRRLGPHKEAREAAEREARQRSDADEQCANGATFQFIEPQRPWSLVPWAFQEHDPSVAKCGVAFRNQTRDFATHFCRVLPFPSVVRTSPRSRRSSSLHAVAVTLELFDLCSFAVAEPRSRLSSLRESPRLSLGPPRRRRRDAQTTAGTRRASCRSGGRSSARARSRRTRGSARSGRSGTRPSARAWPWSTTASRTSRASRVSRVLLVLVSSSFWCAEPAWRGPIRMTQQSRETLYRPTRRRRRRSRS